MLGDLDKKLPDPHNCAEAVMVIADFTLDVTILDCGLHQMDGYAPPARQSARRHCGSSS